MFQAFLRTIGNRDLVDSLVSVDYIDGGCRDSFDHGRKTVEKKFLLFSLRRRLLSLLNDHGIVFRSFLPNLFLYGWPARAFEPSCMLV